MVCLAVAVLFSSCDPDAMSGDGNWWTRMDLAPGIKTITEVSGENTVTYEFDKQGRQIAYKSKWYEEETTYNSEGLITKFVTKTLNESGVAEHTTTTIYTYGGANKDRYLPRELMGGRVMHLNHIGLLPGLTKIQTIVDKDTATVEYSFEGDILTAKGTGKSEWDKFETTCEYKGAYPNKSDGELEFMGPIEYYENGMFKSYREGFKDEVGTITTDRTTTYKNFKDKLNLAEKEVEIYSDGSRETRTSTYDEYGNLTEEKREYDGNTEYTRCTYEYDKKGVWIVMNAKNIAYDGREYNPYTITRTIKYY